MICQIPLVTVRTIGIGIDWLPAEFKAGRPECIGRREWLDVLMFCSFTGAASWSGTGET